MEFKSEFKKEMVRKLLLPGGKGAAELSREIGVTPQTLYNWRDKYSAWEDNEISKKMIEIAARAAVESTNLVVIGYSFPFFNREVDAQIITKMGNLRHIYLQVGTQDASGVEVRIRSFVRPIVKIHPISDLSQFYLPFPI